MSLVAIVVPDMDECLKAWPRCHTEGNLSIKIGEALKCALAKELMSHEIPRQFLVAQDSWTPESGLLTPSMKTKRREIEKHYQLL